MAVGLGFVVRTVKFRKLGSRDMQRTAQMERLPGATSRGTPETTRGGLLTRRLMGLVGFSSLQCSNH